MSRRFRGVLPLVLMTVTVLAAGCDDKTEAAAPATTTPAAPSPPASPSPAGPTKDETCAAVTKSLIDGSVGIADDAVKSIDEHWSSKKVADKLRARFAGMAAEVNAQVPRISDPELKAAVRETAGELAEGATTAKPEAFLKNDFQTLGKRSDKVCAG